jgi:hypothetical protein
MGGLKPLREFSLPRSLEEATYKLSENVFEFIGNYLLVGLLCVGCVLCARCGRRCWRSAPAAADASPLRAPDISAPPRWLASSSSRSRGTGSRSTRRRGAGRQRRQRGAPRGGEVGRAIGAAAEGQPRAPGRWSQS